jgi:hypothetical protein
MFDPLAPTPSSPADEPLDESGEITDFPSIPRKLTIAEVPSGEIRIESGADGAYLLFDCDCKDALPYCRAQCCSLIGCKVRDEEAEALTEKGLECEWDDNHGIVLKRDADGFCTHLDRDTRTCSVYQDRPLTCREFHCTRGADVRGWKLGNSVHRQPVI